LPKPMPTLYILSTPFWTSRICWISATDMPTPLREVCKTEAVIASVCSR
jgi:hypothetical protein